MLAYSAFLSKYYLALRSFNYLDVRKVGRVQSWLALPKRVNTKHDS